MPRKYGNRYIPRGILIDRGYVCIRIWPKGAYYFEEIGPINQVGTLDTAINRLEHIRRDLRNNAFDPTSQQSDSLPFSEVVDTFYRLRGPKLSNDYARKVCRETLNQIKVGLGQKTFDRLSYMDVVAYWESILARGTSVCTANKHLMWISNIYSRFKVWNSMVPDTLPSVVKIPAYNPVTAAKEHLGRRMTVVKKNRTRIPSEDELKQAKAWCHTNDWELWQAIERAIITMLRKQDLMGLQAGKSVEGVQGKTQRKFNIPIVLERPINFVNFTKRWNALRRALGWMQEKKGQPENERHTTWHDLRHCGPTLLAEMGFDKNLIQEYAGHARIEQTESYINIREHKLQPLADALKSRMATL